MIEVTRARRIGPVSYVVACTVTCAVAVAATVAAGAVLLLGAPAVALSGPQVAVDRPSAAVGEKVRISGTGWQPGDLVDIELCGKPSSNGILRCASGGRQNVSVQWDRTFSEALEVQQPPVECPCTIVVDSASAPPVFLPFEIVEAAKPVGAVAPAGVKLDLVALDGGTSVATWFGAGATPTFSVAVTNTTGAPVRPVLQLSRKDGGGEPLPVSTPELPKIAPGESTTIQVPVRLDGLAQGKQLVEGVLSLGDASIPVSASTTVAPWGLYGIGMALLLGLGFVRVRTVLTPEPAQRARQHQRPQGAAAPVPVQRSTSLPEPAPHEPAPHAPAPHAPAPVIAADPFPAPARTPAPVPADAAVEARALEAINRYADQSRASRAAQLADPLADPLTVPRQREVDVLGVGHKASPVLPPAPPTTELPAQPPVEPAAEPAAGSSAEASGSRGSAGTRGARRATSHRATESRWLRR